jgi:hypothetical protein
LAKEIEVVPERDGNNFWMEADDAGFIRINSS